MFIRIISEIGWGAAVFAGAVILAAVLGSLVVVLAEYMEAM